MKLNANTVLVNMYGEELDDMAAFQKLVMKHKNANLKLYKGLEDDDPLPEGAPHASDIPKLLIGTAIKRALLANFADQKELGDEKLPKFDLALRVERAMRENEDVELEDVDCILIKEQVSKAYDGTMMYGLIHYALKGKVVSEPIAEDSEVDSLLEEIRQSGSDEQ